MKKNGGVKVLAVTGHSGGHIFPALSFLAELKKRQQGIEAVLVLPKKNIRYEVIPDNYKLKQILVTSLEFGPNLKTFKALLNFCKGLLESLFIFFEFRPDIVVGFGSLNSIPLVLCGWFFRAKTMIHEQNVIPGRANRLLAKFADKVAVSFAETKGYLKINQENIVFTGNPLRQELKKIDRLAALHFFRFDDLKFTILVMGGSQGSQRINACFFKAISTLPDKSRLQVIHITGERDHVALEKSYQEIDLNARVFVFLKQIQYAYSICDLAVSRAGATAISELIFFRVPAIIIPYPFAYQHQQANARILEEKGAAQIINDDALTSQALAKTINRIISGPQTLKAMRQGFGNISIPDAHSLLTDAVLSLALKF